MDIKRPKSEQQMPESATKVFTGVIYDVYQWDQKMYDGSTKTFEKLKRPDSVIIFPVLGDSRIILTEQEQPGVESYISATGGRVDEGENVLDAAKRELLEESGYEADQFILWDAQHATTKIDWVIYTFIAKGLKKVADPKLDGGEKIKLKLVTFDEFLELSTNNRFSEIEIVVQLTEARLDPKKKAELKKLFDPIIR